MNKTIKKMCVSAMLMAVVYLLTTFVSFPIYSGQGYLNFGDAIIFLASVIVGPWWGALVGAVAGAMADLTVGAVFYIPFTIVAKGGEAIIAGLLYKVFYKMLSDKHKWVASFSFILGGVWMIAVYFCSYAAFYLWGTDTGWTWAWLPNVAFDTLQAGVGAGLGIALTITYEKIWPYKLEDNK